MKRLAIFLSILASTAMLAQTAPERPPEAVAEAAENAAPCVPAGESGASPAEGEEAARPCVEPSPETFPEEEPYLTDLPDDLDDEALGEGDDFDSAVEENNLPTSASVEEEFKPGDEISEDYPVPLPSDI